MKFGVMQSAIGGATDVERVDRAKKLGFDGIELDLRVSELKTPGHERLKELRRLAEAGGAALPSLVLGEHNSGGLAAWWRDAQAEEEVRLALQWCSDVRATTLLLPFFFFNEPKGRTHRAAVCERLKPLCAEAAKQNLVIAFEGVMRAEHLREMADLIQSPAFGVYYDVANATWCDYDIANEIRLLGPLLRQIHAKEAKVFTGDAHLGQGRVNHAGAAEALRSIGYDQWMVLETPVGSDEEVSRDLDFARRVYGGRDC